MSRLGTEATDEMLMVRYQRGDREAFAHLVRRHASGVYSYAYRALGDPTDAQLVTEQAFFSVVGRTAEFKHEARFTAWLFSMVHGLCVLRARPETNASMHADHVPLPSSPEGPAPTGVEHRNTAMQAADALADLPVDQREAFLLRVIGHLPFADIAAITQSDPDTVRSRVRHALERMHQAVSESEEYARALR
jgi:RNA polymerase sigma-70 factor (ECF subfamily)